MHLHTSPILSWNSTGKIGRIGRHLAEKPDVEVTMCFGPMPPDASDFLGGIPALDTISHPSQYRPSIQPLEFHILDGRGRN